MRACVCPTNSAAYSAKENDVVIIFEAEEGETEMALNTLEAMQRAFDFADGGVQFQGIINLVRLLLEDGEAN